MVKCVEFLIFFQSLLNFNKDENVHRFAFSAIKGKLLGREREWEREWPETSK